MRYFKNNYKKMIMPTIFLIIIGFVSYVLPLLIQYIGSHVTTNTGGLAAFLIISGLFIPVYEGRVLKNKRGGDMFYSLPLNKTQLNFKIYLKGLIQIITAFLIVYLLGFITIIIRNYDFAYIQYIPMFFLSLIGIIGYYSFNWFAFSKGNSLIDGIIIIALYNILPLVVGGSFLVLFIPKYSFSRMTMYLPSSIIFTQANYYHHLLTNSRYITVNNISFGMTVILPTLIWLAISIGLLTFNLLYTKSIKPEDIEQKSDNYFAYRTLIPIGVVAMMLFFQIGYFQGVELIGAILIFVGAYIGYVIYQRTFKVNSKYLLLTVGLIVLSIIINVIINRVI